MTTARTTSRLATHVVKKPWGVTRPKFAAAHGCAQRIGELHFQSPPQLSELLIKFIFSSESLSVQVHPNDEQAQQLGHGAVGKDECWLVTDAAEDARVAIGLSQSLDMTELRAATLDGRIEDYLQWHPAKRGSFFYIPAGTIHAIGGGIELIEVQKNSDLTYRLYDYGRGRDLHVEEALSVAYPHAYDGALSHHMAMELPISLVDGPHFRCDRLVGEPDADVLARYNGDLLILPISGTIKVAGEEANMGDCAHARQWSEIEFSADSISLICQPC